MRKQYSVGKRREKRAESRIENQVENRIEKRQSGFTLVELMVVVAIIGILASIGIPQLQGFLLSSETVEPKEMMGRIGKNIVGYTSSRSRTTTQFAEDLDNRSLGDPDAERKLSQLIPQLELPADAKWEYLIQASTEGTGEAEELVYCITATAGAATSNEGGTVIFSSSTVDDATWTGKFSDVNYIVEGESHTAAGACTSGDTIQ